MSNRGRDKFNRFKPVIIGLSKFYTIFPIKFRKKLLVHYRMKKGVLGITLRYALLKSICKNCGDNVSIHDGVYIFEPQNLSIGNNVSIHPMCYIDATGEIEIGNDVSIAHGVTVMSTTHNFEDINVPIKDQGVEKSKVVISNNVWIGAKSTILCGKTIGTGSVIGASSVITKDVLPHCVVAGVPAKHIKDII